MLSISSSRPGSPMNTPRNTRFTPKNANTTGTPRMMRAKKLPMMSANAQYHSIMSARPPAQELREPQQAAERDHQVDPEHRHLAQLEEVVGLAGVVVPG